MLGYFRIFPAAALIGLVLLSSLLLSHQSLQAVAGSTPALNRAPVISSAAPDVAGFRRQKKVGLGLSLAGPSGFVGGQMELHFTSQSSLLLGVGGGPARYRSFNVHAKRVFPRRWFMPYLSAGYARWNSSSPSNHFSGTTTPPFLGEKLLTDSERTGGVFSKHLLLAGAGLQYFQLSGDFAGASLFVEVLGMVELQRFVFAPTSHAGLMIYF